MAKALPTVLNGEATERYYRPLDADAAAVIESVVLAGDLARMQPADRVAYYRQVCQSVGLNPLTRPFDYITLNGKLTLYARKDAADQLRKIHGVSIEVLERAIDGDLIVVHVRARCADGRQDEDFGAVTLPKSGDARANAIMKAVTKAKRRATLSICGLGWLDETELETIPDARPVAVDFQTGEVQLVSRNALPEPGPQALGPVTFLDVCARMGEMGIRGEPMQRAFASCLLGTHLARIEDCAESTTETLYSRLGFVMGVLPEEVDAQDFASFAAAGGALTSRRAVKEAIAAYLEARSGAADGGEVDVTE